MFGESGGGFGGFGGFGNDNNSGSVFDNSSKENDSGSPFNYTKSADDKSPFGGGGSPFDTKKEDSSDSPFGGGGSPFDKNDDSSGPFGGGGSPFEKNEETKSSSPFERASDEKSSGSFDKELEPEHFSSDKDTNNMNTSVHGSLNERENNYGNMSVVDKMRGMQGNRLNIDGEITLAEQYADKSLDRRVGDGRHNVTMTDVYTDEHLYRAVKGLNTDGFIEDPAEHSLVDQEGDMNLNDYHKNDDFDPLTGRKKSPNASMFGGGGSSDEGFSAMDNIDNNEEETPAMGFFDNKDEAPKEEEGTGFMTASAEVVGGVALMGMGRLENQETEELQPDVAVREDHVAGGGAKLPTNIKNMRRGDFDKLKFDGRGNVVGPDGKPIMLSPSDKSALDKKIQEFSQPDEEPVKKEKKKHVDPLDEMRELREAKEAKEREENGEDEDDKGDGEFKIDEGGAAIGAAVGLAAIAKKGKKNKSDLEDKFIVDSDEGNENKIEFDQQASSKNIYDEKEVREAKELGVSLKEYREYKEGKIDKPVQIMSFKEIKDKIEEMNVELNELEHDSDIEFKKKEIELMESEMIKKIADLF